MANPRLLALLLVVALLALSFSQGTVEARKVQLMRAAARRDGRWLPHRGRLLRRQEEAMAYTLMDYGPPTANTNTRGMVPPTDPTSPPTH
ncbi:hypothetical protein ACP70R_045040 [Stipagrostis hirtigluma subsp. patula]